ncbi:MAG: TonB-dependent receptor [Bacteroidales bacterium]|nr:TonB-dependent receptor [Bacteroidales bacterium]
MNQLLKRLVAFMAIVFVGVGAHAQVTTSSMNGLITDTDGEPLAGAAVIATHTPSGTQYATAANADGRFIINGMRTGGPYVIDVSFIGMETVNITDVTLKLGDPYELNLKMKSSEQLDAVYIVSDKSFNANKTGAGDHFNHQAVESMPTVDRSIYDIVKYTPQASVNKGGGISFAGSNNRYNSFQIDGAIANDAFGLAASGTNGGQTGANPISLDAIEEIQVVVAPFDVRQSGFTGGAMNAITKSGTNQLRGSAYAYYNNQDFIGTTAGPIAADAVRTKYEDQLTLRAGATLGGPIIKDKLFFFASGEYYKKSRPNVYNPGAGTYNGYFSNTNPIGVAGADIYKEVAFPVTVNGQTTELTGQAFDGTTLNTALADAILARYASKYGPDENFSESYTPHQVEDLSINALLRLDWNINTDNKLMFRYQFAHAYADQYGSGRYTYYFNNSSYKMVDYTNTFVLELNSRINEMMSNEARATAVLVRDHREIPYKGANIYITGDTYTINLGTEYSSGANAMNSDAYTLTDNFSIFAGKHNITIGTHNELFRFYNIFRQYAFGEYKYTSIANFFEDTVDTYYYNYADPELTGGVTNWGATTWAAQFGLYAQDEWKPNRDFTLTYGLRADMPLLLNKPTENVGFNLYADTFKDTFPELYNARVGEVPKASILLSPRVGFRWYMDEEHTAVLRGGAGLFTGRVPFVWLSNAYNNTGMEAKSVQVKGSNLIAAAHEKGVDNILTSDPYNTFIKSGILQASNSGATINTMNRNFKYPQVFRVNLGLDKRWDGGWNLTLDALFSKTLNNVFFQNLAITNENHKVYAVNAEAAAANPASAAAPYYTQMSSAYSTIVALGNTNKGYTYSLSGKLEKSFDFGLNLMASYTYGHAYSVNDGTSSVAFSNWKYNYSVDTNSDELSYSLFDKPHRVMGVIAYNSKPYLAGRMATNISLTYTGESGQRYCYTYNEAADFNGDGFTGNSLMYIPTEEEVPQMNWATAGDAAKFENYIRNDQYLLSHRGQYSARYAGMAPFEHHFDLHFGQDFIFDRTRGTKLQLFADVMNIGNMINREWGANYGSTNNLRILKVTSVSKDAEGNATPTYQYSPYTISLSDFYSRWRCQVGARITF